jgi:hypothetical protein
MDSWGMIPPAGKRFREYLFTVNTCLIMRKSGTLAIFRRTPGEGKIEHKPKNYQHEKIQYTYPVVQLPARVLATGPGTKKHSWHA